MDSAAAPLGQFDCKVRFPKTTIRRVSSGGGLNQDDGTKANRAVNLPDYGATFSFSHPLPASPSVPSCDGLPLTEIALIDSRVAVLSPAPLRLYPKYPDRNIRLAG
jgi:hypothetical protein